MIRLCTERTLYIPYNNDNRLWQSHSMSLVVMRKENSFGLGVLCFGYVMDRWYTIPLYVYAL